jgi:predicted permease
MSLWSRIANVFRGDRLSREIDEELESHLAEAIDSGMSPAEARTAFGSRLRHREAIRDIRLVGWLDSLCADAAFGWRQLMKHKTTSGAAILSLALATGACMASFRIVDALLLRPLPIRDPRHLYALTFQATGEDGKPQMRDSCSYPMFRQMRQAVRDEAELLAISWASEGAELTYSSSQETEKAALQYVSGWTFATFGLQPELGRLFTEDDDRVGGASPVAVLSYEYWSRRFGRDPSVVGRTFRFGKDLYSIVGVVRRGFTGTEPGSMVDVFVPTMMNRFVDNPDANWFRTLIQLKPGVSAERVRAKLHATLRAFREQQAKRHPGMPKPFVESFLHQTALVQPAVTGVSQMQNDYRHSLVALSVLVVLVLLIACSNVANLMTAQAAARAREMALRVSIGAGRWRLVQLVMVESVWVGLFSVTLGALFGWWAAPFVVDRINPPDHPARLVLLMDWRVFGFVAALTVCITLLFGLAPALRASGVKPLSALKGGEDPHARRRLMHALIGLQAAFCFFVLFAAGLFAATFDRLSRQPTGFSAGGVVNIGVVAQGEQPPASWEALLEKVRFTPGVDRAALAGWALMGGGGWDGYVSIDGGPVSNESVWLLNVSPGWIGAMSIPLVDGRDLQAEDVFPKRALVNKTFAKKFFKDQNPLGKSFGFAGRRVEIVGLVGDARYTDMRGPIPPTVYVPFRSLNQDGGLEGRSDATLVVRTSLADPLALTPALRQAVSLAGRGFRIRTSLTQQELDDAQTIRERLLALLALFFASVALLLAGIGLYGVLEYSVFQRRREIGIRMAIGAQGRHIAARVTASLLSMVVAGGLVGLGVAMGSARFVETLLFQVKPDDPGMLAIPAAAMLLAAFLAALPAVRHAVRIDPACVLRGE